MVFFLPLSLQFALFVYVKLASLAQLLCRAAGSLTFPPAILLWQSCSDYSLAHTTPGSLAHTTPGSLALLVFAHIITPCGLAHSTAYLSSQLLFTGALTVSTKREAR